MKSVPGGAEVMGTAVLEDVKRFAAGRPPGDDLTLMCVSREG